MAIPTKELARLRQRMAERVDNVNWDKPTINSAFDALETDFESAAQINRRRKIIEDLLPGVFSDARKDRIIKIWMQSKGGRS